MTGLSFEPVRKPQIRELTFEQLLDSDEAAALLKIHPKTLQKMARNGEIAGVQVGRLSKIRNLMSALYSHAIRWEWAEKNPIKSVRQSAKRMCTPDVLTPEEITALLGKLPEPLRTACELDAFTGLRRGELIGLQWQDVDFEDLVIHVRRSVVLIVAGTPKTEASAKDVPLDAALAESLLKLKLAGPYNGETDWVFASVTMKGRQPLWPETL